MGTNAPKVVHLGVPKPQFWIKTLFVMVANINGIRILASKYVEAIFCRKEHFKEFKFKESTFVITRVNKLF